MKLYLLAPDGEEYESDSVYSPDERIRVFVSAEKRAAYQGKSIKIEKPKRTQQEIIAAFFPIKPILQGDDKR